MSKYESYYIGKNWNDVRHEIGGGNGQIVTFVPKDELIEISVDSVVNSVPSFIVYFVNLSGQIVDIDFKEKSDENISSMVSEVCFE